MNAVIIWVMVLQDSGAFLSRNFYIEFGDDEMNWIPAHSGR